MGDSIIINKFEAGWCPSDDQINGRKNCFLQMDNVDLDKNGAVSMIGGTSVKWTGFPAASHSIYSRIMNGARKDYTALTNGAVYRNQTSIATGGDTSNAGFGTAFNYTLIASGSKLLKDDGATAVTLGILPPTAVPTLTVAPISGTPYSTIGDLAAHTVTPIGASAYGAGYLQITANGSGNAAIQTYNPSIGVQNGFTFTDTLGTGFSEDSDTFKVTGYLLSPIGKSLKVDILLVAGSAAGDPVSDFYTFIIDLGTVAYDPLGVFTIKIRRDEFVRTGNGVQDWGTVWGFRFSFISTTPADVINVFANIGSLVQFEGGSRSLTGTYQYLQVNVNNTGSYLAKSIGGPISKQATAFNTQIGVVPQNPTAIDAQVNEVWMFRRGGLLDTWYRIAVLTSSTWATFGDTLSDNDALALNIKLDINLISVKDIPDKIFSIVGPVEGRWFYFTTNMMYPSAINDPDLVNSNLAIRTCGSNSEIFLGAELIGEAAVLVSTSVDFYLLTGTFQTLPDFTIDLYYRALGCKFPSITYDMARHNGEVVYMASDGWRSIDSNGANKTLVAPNTDQLYRGTSRYGYTAPSINIISGATRFPVCIGKNKLWCFITGTGRCEVYDLLRNYWRTFDYGLNDVSNAAATQDGQIIAFYSTDKKIREIDISTSKLIDATTKQTITLLSPVLDNDTPKQRKDSQTLKLRLYTGATGTLTAKLTTDNGTTTNISTAIASNTRVTEIDLDLSSIAAVAISKTYQLTLTGALQDFLWDDAEILFETRPPQVSFIRVQSTNYGTIARKRLYEIPGQIDTLGHDVVLTPYVDNIAQLGLVLNSVYKQSFNYKFPISAGDVPLGRDYEYTLYSAAGLFEFFGFQEPRGTEIFPDPVTALVIPVTNFNSASKKRIRVWPFIIDPLGGNVTFTPLVDKVSTAVSNYSFSGKQTIRHQFTTDVFGVDYSGYFSSTTPFEFWGALQPEIVEILPIAKKFDQVGPQELFRFGKIKQLEVRILPDGGTVLPITIYFNDAQNYSTTATMVDGKEASYFIDMPKGVSGNIIRIELGPTVFDFHRFYMKAQVARSGDKTELEWVHL